MTHPVDLAIVGSGFSGSLLALIARRLGRSVVLLERGRHPRFAIGESSSPLANLLLEELARRYDLPRLRPLSAWGPWRRAYPEIGCGLKRGFTFFRTKRGGRSRPIPTAATSSSWPRARTTRSPTRTGTGQSSTTFSCARPRATARNTPTRRRPPSFRMDRTASSWPRRGREGVANTAPASSWTPRARTDSSTALEIPASPFAALPATEALWAHFTGVRRLDESAPPGGRDAPPYPVDDAAVHHVFDGGWIWVLRFASGVTSAGVAAEPALGNELRLCDGAPAWDRLLERYPTVRAQFSNAHPATSFVHRPGLPFRSAAAAGAAWALMPSAAAFVDPLLSTGFPLTLLGIERLAAALEDSWGRPGFEERLRAHERLTLFEADTAALLVGALYATFGDFPVFAALTTLYFAAASYAEAARRLKRPHLSGSFLSGDHPVFGPALKACCSTALERDGRRRDELLAMIRRAIEPLDVIGLSDTSRRNWYPVLAEDLIASRAKLGASREEIDAVLESLAAEPSVHGV